MERVSLREFGRRVGVSDTAIRKAIEAGRISDKAVTKNAKNGRPELFYDKALSDWKLAGGGLIKESLATTKTEPQTLRKEVKETNNEPATASSSLAEAKRKRAIYEAQLKGIELAEKTGSLVSKSKVYEELFSFSQEIKSSLLSIPDKYLDLILSAKDRHESDKILREALHESLLGLANINQIKI